MIIFLHFVYCFNVVLDFQALFAKKSAPPPPGDAQCAEFGGAENGGPQSDHFIHLPRDHTVWDDGSELGNYNSKQLNYCKRIILTMGYQYVQ